MKHRFEHPLFGVTLLIIAGLLIPLSVAARDDKSLPPRPAQYIQAWNCREVTWKPADHDYQKPPRAVVESIIETYGLHAGDVIGFHDHRGSMHYLLDRDADSGAWKWTSHIDASGYLLIPLNATKRRTDALAAYAAVVRGRKAVALELSPKDPFVRRWFGMLGPDWQIVVTTLDGKPEFVGVKHGNADWQEFELFGETPEGLRKKLGR